MNWKTVEEHIKKLTVLVIGDVMIDSYLWGKAERISPEAPVPVVNVLRSEQRLGGAANVARNIKALGAQVYLAAVVGQDEHYQTLLRLLDEEKISTKGIVPSAERPTTIKHRIIAGTQHLLRVDAETDKPLSEQENTALLNTVQALLPEIDVIIFEDYDKGVLNEQNITQIIEWAKSQHITTCVDPKKRNFWAYRNCSLFKPNLKELKDGLNQEINPKNIEDVHQAAKTLAQKLNADHVFVTLSEYGALATQKDGYVHKEAHKREIADVSGAGDTVISIAALGLSLGLKPDIWAALANLGGGLVCEYPGVVPVPATRLWKEAEIYISL
ncbi:MAG: D-glycero-beta-D-manno-heptose-7-phosphate kinase [Cytophagales bacterium]|nr:MAG: D-glycero-beta-D-manno-heptose-7-phosphate kinase [Cytophagales bacterium]TAF60603.1 MAG: D-glycero-beta-D-manno-heptose-7-phosphate kinase [Cytophagales bacterium]